MSVRPRDWSTTLRAHLERAGGYWATPDVRDFASCAADRHDACPAVILTPTLTFLCGCPCHITITPTEWDQAFGALDA